MLDYASKIQEDTGAVQFPLQGTDIFKRLCQIYAEFQDCTHDISCHSIPVKAVDASYGYMCGNGYRLFEKYASCFAEVEVEDDYIKCKKRAADAIKAAQESNKNGDNEQYFKEMCRIMDEYLRCSHPIINRHCGSEAWDLVSTVTMDSLRVTMPSCDMHNALV
ncbi:hypothetical protein AB6A40_005909 [Gnathostoma spinigerum]|uniref:T20D4.11-like domain-containing protein n=1 Tax=Gnathostoma spinigerum TaxID=75299 RepID=A0ABD6ESG6_9BILA